MSTPEERKAQVAAEQLSEVHAVLAGLPERDAQGLTTLLLAIVSGAVRAFGREDLLGAHGRASCAEAEKLSEGFKAQMGDVINAGLDEAQAIVDARGAAS